MRKIVKAAVRNCGRIYSGWDYDECVKQIPKGLRRRVWTYEYGFIDNEGKFCDRVVAKQVAAEAGQVSREKAGVLVLEDIMSAWLREQEDLIMVLREKLKPCPECGEPMGTSEFYDENGSHCLRCEEKKALWYPLSDRVTELEKELEKRGE